MCSKLSHFKRKPSHMLNKSEHNLMQHSLTIDTESVKLGIYIVIIFRLSIVKCNSKSLVGTGFVRAYKS